MVRRAEPGDLAAIAAAAEEGRAAIRALGIDQWSDGYPSPEDFHRDIEGKRCWITQDREGLTGVAVLSLEPEPAYGTLAGEWLCPGEPYGTIHRMAVVRRARGGGAARELVERMEALCRQAGVRSLRCDTHLGNLPMNRFLTKMGFLRRGIVIYPDITTGDPRRVAYEKLLEERE